MGEGIKRQTKSKGGVALYLHDTIKYEIRNDPSLFVQGELESVFAELNRDGNKAKQVYIVPSSSAILSLQQYENTLQKLTSYKHTVILGTDQNFNLLK